MIFITGCARSGTSLTTQIINACGASLGEKGTNQLREATDVRDGLIKPYLKSIGADPMGQYPLPNLDDVRIDDDWREKVLRALGYPEEPWAYKAAKACLFWPLWKDAFPEAKWIIVRRDREKIVESCIRTGFMRAHKSREGWRAWALHHEARFEEMKQEMDCIELWPDMDPETFRPAVEWCGLEFDYDAVASVINPSKWHGSQ